MPKTRKRGTVERREKRGGFSTEEISLLLAYQSTVLSLLGREEEGQMMLIVNNRFVESIESMSYQELWWGLWRGMCEGGDTDCAEVTREEVIKWAWVSVEELYGKERKADMISDSKERS